MTGRRTSRSNEAGSNASQSTSSSLLERVKSQDQQAWSRLVKLYGPLVHQRCRHLGLNAQDREDVCQEVFIAVAANIRSFHRERPGESFYRWFCTITRNKIFDHFRKRRAQPQAKGGTNAQQQLGQIPDEVLDGSSTSDSSVDDQKLLQRRALELLRTEFEERTWSAFWGMAIKGRTAAEVGKDLGMAKRAVRQAKYRVLRRLRLELDGLIG